MDYQKLFNDSVVKKTSEIDYVIKRILTGKTKYENAVKGTKIPWYFIGIIHSMECNCNFNLHIHNGDPLSARTVQVPAKRPIAEPLTGKGKPYSWEESCKDCIQYKTWDKIENWNIPTLLYQWERNNGFGYQKKGINTPYLWSYTNQYTKGKYVADGKYDADAISKQIGCVAIFKALQEKNYYK